MKTSALVLALSVAVSACITSRAQTPVERPTLDVPPVPPRVIDPAPPPEVSVLEPVADLPPERATTPAPKPRAASPKEIGKETAKPESQKTEIPPVEPPPVAPPAPVPPTIKTATTVDSAGIRDTILRAGKMLNSIDYTRLKPETKTAYNQAKSHKDEAEAALKRSDFDLAKELAEKAEKLAREIQNR